MVSKLYAISCFCYALGGLRCPTGPWLSKFLLLDFWCRNCVSKPYDWSYKHIFRLECVAYTVQLITNWWLEELSNDHQWTGNIWTFFFSSSDHITWIISLIIIWENLGCSWLLRQQPVDKLKDTKGCSKLWRTFKASFFQMRNKVEIDF